MKNSSRIKWSMLLMLSIVLSNCVSFSPLQGVKTLDQGEASLSGGLSVFGIENDNVGVFPEVGMRLGLSDRVDIGAKLFMPLSIFVDAKVELVQKPVTVSLDMGYSSFTLLSGSGETKNRTDGFYPMVMAGQERWYLGVKPMLIFTEGEIDLFGSTSDYSTTVYMATDVVLGAVIGDRIRFLPEVNILFSPDWTESVYIPGFGVELHF